jgi:hypothetical protein
MRARFIRRFSLLGALGLLASVLHAQTLPALTGYTFTSLTLPPSLAAPSVQLFGINDFNQVVGLVYGSDPNAVRSFVYQSGNYTEITVPGYGSIEAFGINNQGQIVGGVGNGNLSQPGVAVGFISSGGSTTILNYAGEPNFVPRAINESGVLVGTANNSAFITTGSTLTRINAFGNPSFSTYGNGLNNNGTAVGSYFNGQFGGYTYSAGTFTSFAPPGAVVSGITDINDSGVIVGHYVVGDVAHSYIFTSGASYEVTIPGATGVWVNGINNQGSLVGFYSVAGVDGFTGFVATAIPEPATWALLSGLAVMGAAISWRRLPKKRNPD